MNLHDPQHPWSRLTKAARRAPDEADAAAPYGFATRVVARAFGGERRGVSLIERFALRAASVAALVAALSVAVNYPVLANRAETELTEAPATSAAAVVTELDVLGTHDSVSVVLDLSE